jgi:carbamoyl-phosphate synthase small subunit
MPGEKATLLLEDGTRFDGRSFGWPGEICAEVVFNTAMTGYQEIATDPSYCGQMVTMTYPLIGNYGVNRRDVESARVCVAAMIVKEIAGRASNWRRDQTIEEYFAANRVMGLEGIDTRELVRHIRVRGAMRGILSTEDADAESLLRKVLASPEMAGRDLVLDVSTAAPYAFPNDSTVEPPDLSATDLFVVAYDFGIKENILRQLVGIGARTLVVPATTKAAEIETLRPDGIFLSNGPGDPAALGYIIEELKKLLPRYPVFGICLGHQLMGWAFGGKTYKLKFGHRGANHPVKDMTTTRVEITSQNHGFCVDPESLPATVDVTHWNLNDQTVEGLQHKEFPAFCVQYHPEASPGPHDSHYLFHRFREFMLRNKKAA